MIKAILVLLLLALPAAAIEKNEKESHMDAHQKSADSLLSEADAVFKANNMTEAATAYEKAFEMAGKEFNRSVETEALAQIARCHLKTGEKDAGREWLKKAEERAIDSDPLGWTRYLGVKGRFEWHDDDLSAARKTFGEMYEYSVANALYTRCIDAANMMGIVSETGDEQMEWYRRGIEMAEKSEAESMLAQLWNNLAATYYDNKQFDSALAGYEKAREFHWRFNGEIQKLYADYAVGTTLRSLGRLEEAASWLRPVLAWAERLGDPSAQGQALQDLGEIEIANGNKSSGVAMLKKARDFYKKAGFDTSWEEVWDGINKRLAELE